MIKEVKGNLLEAAEFIIAHQVNCKGVMGAGVARQIKEKLLPKEEFTKYYILCKQYPANILLGHVQLCNIHTNGQPKIIANLFAEDVPTGKGLDKNYEPLQKCLDRLFENRHCTFALPGYLGCGLAGGDWNRVYDMIRSTAKAHEADVTLYYLESSIKMLWEDFGDIPMDPETECLEEAWHGFAVGTHREEIWHWFEETFHVSVAELMGLTPKILPSLEEIRADYKAFRELTKDVRTLENIKKLRHQFVIEINGVSISEFEEMPTEIEWVRYDGYGCLEDIYDYFDGKPKVQINCKEHDELRYLVIGAITEDDVTEENYKRWQDWISK